MMSDNGYIIHCLALQETWLNEQTLHLPSLHINGYNFIYKPCRLSRHSGVAFYLLSEYKFDLISNTDVDYETFESLDIKVALPSTNIILSNTYRPPRNNQSLFLSELEGHLDKIKQSGNITLLGDFNINLLEINNKSSPQAFLELAVSHGLCPTITLPSRLSCCSSGSTSSLIDNIFIKQNNVHPTNSFILIDNLSDHFPVFSSIHIGKQQYSNNKKFYTTRKQGEKEFTLFKGQGNRGSGSNRPYHSLVGFI